MLTVDKRPAVVPATINERNDGEERSNATRDKSKVTFEQQRVTIEGDAADVVAEQVVHSSAKTSQVNQSNAIINQVSNAMQQVVNPQEPSLFDEPQYEPTNPMFEDIPAPDYLLQAIPTPNVATTSSAPIQPTLYKEAIIATPEQLAQEDGF